jgi:thiol:disulfide interchange protein DsbD
LGWLVCAVLLLSPCETRAQIAGTGLPGLDDDPQVEASLVSDALAIAPGGTLHLAVSFKLQDGWHLNWMNPGDAGLAPSIAWHLPEGFAAGPPCWPFPQRFSTGPIVIFGYSGELMLVADVRVPANLTPGTSLEFKADVSWLACAEACVPGNATVALTLPVRPEAAADTAGSARIESWLARCPRPTLEWNIDARIDNQDTIALNIGSGASQWTFEDLFFFPYDPGIIENAAPQQLAVLSGTGGRSVYQLRIEVSRMATGVPDRLSGVLVSGTSWFSGTTVRAIEFDVPLSRR